MNIEQSRELLETPNVKTRAISSQASKEEGSTTIRGDGVPSSEGKCETSIMDDDIVWSTGKPVAVYQITNMVNNKIYIGYTTKTIANRMATHRWTAKNGSKSYLHTAMRKYGFEVFDIKLISNHASVKEAKETEIKLIAELRKNNIPNYNLLDGGNGGLYVKDKEAWKAKLRAARKGKTPFKGFRHTEEAKRKCGEASKRRWDKRNIANDNV